MTLVQKRANKEVSTILNKLNLMKYIPNNVIQSIKKNSDESWNFVYDDSLELYEQKILRETAILFSTLYIMYICEDEKEKEELKKLYDDNEKSIGKELSFEDYISKIFKK